MATSNAERQKAHREKLKAYRNELRQLRPQPYTVPRDWLDHAKPGYGAQRALAVLLAVLADMVQHGKVADVDISPNDDRLNFELTGEPGSWPHTAGTWHAYNALRSPAFAAWLSPAAIRLWQDGAPIRLQISVTAVLDKRKLKATARRLEREAEEDEEDASVT